jgi:hypothetical protein
MTTFKQQLDRAYANKVVGTLEKTVRAVAFIVDNQLAVSTPVDTGRARANWQPSLNTPATGTLQPGQKPDAAQVAAAYKIADQILITNNLPYIRRLNEGSSKQAPAGFVDEAIAVGKRAVKGAVRAIVRGSTR